MTKPLIGQRSTSAKSGTREAALERRTGCLCREIQELQRLGTVRFSRPAKAGRGLGKGANALARADEPLSRRASRVGLSPLRGARRISWTLASSRVHPTFNPFDALGGRLPRWGLALTIGFSLSIVESSTRLASADPAGGELFPAGSRPAGYKLGLLATACWMGGVWSDAEGLPRDRWAALDHQRCQDLVASIYGHPDQVRFEQIRATESRAVDDWLAKIRVTEPAATRARTVALFSDVAAAAHEGMLARRAADRVKVDYDRNSVEMKLTKDERTAAEVLQNHAALDKLLVTTEFAAADRRAIGTLFAMDRMEIASGLPKALKFYAVGGVFTTTFDAAPPAVALNPIEAPRPGAWLVYLTGVASRAGYHNISDGAGFRPGERETLAWTGVARGFADRLRVLVVRLPAQAVPELSRIVNGVATRLETERQNVEQFTGAHASGGP